jgi:hypothetical protein
VPRALLGLTSKILITLSIAFEGDILEQPICSRLVAAVTENSAAAGVGLIEAFPPQL